MIVFDLQCEARHAFEAWFANSGAFEDQRAAGQVPCPVCGSVNVGKAAMAPRITPSSSGNAPDFASLLPKIAAMQAAMLKQSTWVGSEFTQKARAMADGEAPQTAIHGTATRDQAIALHDDGVPVMPLLVPIVPPEALN